MTLVLDHLSKAYGRSATRAVQDLNLRIENGEFIALLGSSGCGKTSTLRMIAGFEAVTEGSIALSGRRIDGLPPARRNVAMVFEGYALYPPLTIEDNIGFGLIRPGSIRGSASASSRICWRSGRSSSASRLASPAVSSSAPRSLAPWRAMPNCICWTSLWGSWSRSCARCCVAGSRR